MQDAREFMQTHPQTAGRSTEAPAPAQTGRREALRRILRASPVRRQTDLVRLLQAEGYAVTQSSISRDLRELGVAKRGDRYLLPEDTAAASSPDAELAAVAGFVQQIRAAGPSLTVVRTAIGAAQSVALAIDRARWPEIVGTISGDDTLFIATEGVLEQRTVTDRLRSIFRI
jgi:transcriptional regulator of arginine metabolism